MRIRPFAMWITKSLAMTIRQPQTLVSGVAMGSGVDPGDALLLHSPFALPIRMHCRAVGSVPRGGESAAVAIGVDPVSFDPRQLVGGILAQEGTSVRAFTATLKGEFAVGKSAVRFDLRGDRAWGLVDITQGILNAVVIGGGLGERDLWSVLDRIVLRDRNVVVHADDLVPVVDDEHPWLLQLPTLTKYDHGDDAEARVLRPAGPVCMENGFVRLAHWLSARLVQQREGLTQLIVEKSRENVVVVPFLPIAA